MRSTSRTRKRNERDRAPMTIDARSATESGTASSRMSSTASRLARCAERGAVGRGDPAEVHDAAHSRPRWAAAAKRSAASRSREANGPPSAGSMPWMRK